MLQKDEYFAFGKRVVVTPGTNKYLYNGKELQEESETYDYRARFYDPVIARWNVPDLLSERHYDLTPYNYVMNNPLMFIDPLGLDTIKPNQLVSPKPGIKPFNPGVDVISLSEVKIVAGKPGGSNGIAGSRDPEKSLADNVGLADALLGPIAGGSERILRNRGAYLPRNEVFRRSSEIIVRTPMANISVSSRLLNRVRLGGKVLGVAGLIATSSQIYSDIDKQKYYSAGTRTLVASVAIGAGAIPVVGWGIAGGIGVADYIWGDEFYDYVETKMK